jgi:Rieske Fe-S protein
MATKKTALKRAVTDNVAAQVTASVSSSRRDFLKTALTVSVFATTGAKELLGNIIGDEYTDKNGSLAAIYTMQFRDFPALRTVGGSVRIVFQGVNQGEGIMVTRATATSITAVSETCTHAACMVNMYNPTTQRFSCPCHGSEFDVTGRVLQGPARINLTRFTVMFTSTNDFVQVDLPGLAVSVKDQQNDVPTTSTLAQNMPNPASGYTTIEYGVDKASNVTITLYSALGKEVAKIVDRFHEAGVYKALYDASNLHRGVYFYRMETSHKFSQTRKMTVSQ